MLFAMMIWLKKLTTSLILTAVMIAGVVSTDATAFELPAFLSTPPKELLKVIAHQLKCQPYFNQPLVQKQIRWYLKNPKYLTVLTENAQPYLYYVYQEAKRRHMPVVVALLPMIESNYNPFLYSSQGATGLWQLMPGTATGLGIPITWWYDGRRDIIQSTSVALDYLSYLHHFLNNWLLAIAAYNSGAGTILHAVHYNRAHGRPTDYWHLALPAETKAYVPKLLALAAIISDPYWQAHLPGIAYQPYLTSVRITGQYDLSYLAKISQISTEELRFYNPGFRRFSTGPLHHHLILIPISSKAHFLSTIKNQRAASQLTWQHYNVQPGDNLINLGHHFHTTPAIIKRVNRLKTDALKLNQSLLIPETRHYHSLTKIEQAADIAENHLPGPQLILHKVKPRESQWSLAKKYRVKTKEIRFWNHLSRHDRLRPNQVITLWVRHRTFKEHALLHLVNKNETLSTLAQRYHTSAHLIRLYNHLHSTVIRANQILKIPYPKHQHYYARYQNQMVSHTVVPGDSIGQLARYYNVSKKELIKWNHLNPKHFLRLGQVLTVYLHHAG